MRSAASLSHRHKRIEREGHVMIRRFGFRGLAVGLFVACAAMVAAPAAQADPTGAMSTLTAVTGQGTGMFILSPTSSGHGNFVAQVKLNIHGATPNTTFSFTRSIDRPADGVCSTDYFGIPALTTSAGGTAALEIEAMDGPTAPFDLSVRLVGSDGTVLQTRCMTIIGK
jgi:hypothetical protein